MAERLDEVEQARIEVAALYKEGIAKHLAGQRVHGKKMEIPPRRWRTLAENYPQLKDIILEFGKVVSKAEFARDYVPNPPTEGLRHIFSSFIHGNDHRVTQFLLADILHHRIEQSGSFVSAVRITPEAHAVLVEYGLKEGLLTDSPMEPLDLRSVVGKVLSGAIKLSPTS